MYYDLKESGLRIKKLRKQKGLTQEQLADKLNISTSNLGKLERGLQGLSIDLLIELSIFFDVSLDYIFGRTDDPHGMIYNNCVKLGLNNPEMARFVEMCFDPGSARNERLKATLVQMLSEVETK